VGTTYEYDGLDRLTRLRDAKAALTIADKQYQYNNAGQITQLTDLGGVHAYGSDAVDRLTSASYPNTPTESYSYDAVGNRTSSHLSASYTHQSFNRLTSTASATYSYDNNGNLLSKTDGAGTTQYQWDFENRLKQVTLPSGDVVAYKYDALGRRIERSTITLPLITSTTRYIYDGSDVIRDTDANGATTVDYLNGSGIDNKIRQTANGTSFYFLADQLGSTTALTDSQGTVVEQITYDSFGNSSGSALTRYTYTGREHDPLTSQFYYRARFYDPGLGRFTSEDPIAFLGRDVNLYGYVHNDPLRFVDPSGLRRCHPLLGAIAGGALGGVAGAAGGGILGGLAGGTLGGVGLSFVVPGIGTIAGFGGGAAVGAQAGAYLGSGIGIGLGIGYGIDYCNTEDACDKTETKPWSPNPPSDKDRDKSCNRQLYEIDYPMCDGVGRARGPAAYSKCIASAHQRYAACLRGLPLPPLDTWNN
jgi:RHS repeat-associated protein